MLKRKLSTEKFTSRLPVCEHFSDALVVKQYQRLPADWLIAVTDVVKSREAIKQGRFKPVNMAGVAMITSIMNALGHQDLPYIFGGDGAAVACSPMDQETVARALAQTARWVEDELQLTLRAALVPVSEVRKQKADVLVAAVRISPAIVNYAFQGGGVAVAEAMMKQGEYKIEHAEAGDYPDLNGLSCRWTPIEEEQSKFISLIVEPGKNKKSIPARLSEKLLGIVRGDDDENHPLPEEGPEFVWPPKGLELEARARRGNESLFKMKLYLYLATLIAWFLGKTNIPLGEFKPDRYRRYTAMNTDYRKIQDGIRMTVSLPQERISQLREFLEGCREKGEIHYGMSEQDQAVLTCFVPSITSDAHYHFLDGAGGGYAAAADNLK